MRRLRDLNERAAGGKLSDDPHALGMHDGDTAYRENADKVDAELIQRNGKLSLPTMTGKRVYPVMLQYLRPYQDTSEFAALSMPDAKFYNAGFESGFLNAMKGRTVREAAENQTQQEREVSEALDDAQDALSELHDHAVELERTASKALSEALSATADEAGVKAVVEKVLLVEEHAVSVNKFFEEARAKLKEAGRLAGEPEAPEESA